MRTDFIPAVRFVLDHEGDGAAGPNDPGGTTRYGISQRAYPDLDLSQLTESQAVAIYLRDYWERLRCNELPRPVALTVMDTAVNCGRRRAACWLQEAYNELTSGYPLKVDGIIGPVTARAVFALSDGCRELVLAQALLNRRLEHYVRLAKREPHRRYLRGWVARVVDLQTEITKPVRWLPV
jgi:lysozyme family protein